jgi:hypothetical protein
VHNLLQGGQKKLEFWDINVVEPIAGMEAGAVAGEAVVGADWTADANI